MSDLFADVATLVEASPLYGKGQFIVDIRYSVEERGCLFEMIFQPEEDDEGEAPRIIKTKWIIDLVRMAEEEATHRELVQKGLEAVYEAYQLQSR